MSFIKDYKLRKSEKQVLRRKKNLCSFTIVQDGKKSQKTPIKLAYQTIPERSGHRDNLNDDEVVQYDDIVFTDTKEQYFRDWLARQPIKRMQNTH